MVRLAGSARQSQLVTTYGVGSIIPTRDSSFMVMGLDHWDERRSQVVLEPRLAKSLGVSLFRSPPSGGSRGDVPVARFPLTHYCPACRALGGPGRFRDEGAKLSCTSCERDVTPSRFIACCESGHIEDFPFQAWVHRGSRGPVEGHVLSMRSLGRSSSLGDIVIQCSCGQSASMKGALGRMGLAGLAKCRGQRPWLESDSDEKCEMPLRGLQRGSSNVWFAEVRSTISIPPWTSPSAAYVEHHWEVLQDLDDEARQSLFERKADASRELVLDELVAHVRRRRGLVEAVAPTDEDLRADEYRALESASGEGARDSSFLAETVRVDESLSRLVNSVSKVSRLREVRALHGFARVSPGGGTSGPSPLSEHVTHWLPAVEVHGEGVFLRLDSKNIDQWSRQVPIAARLSKLETAKSNVSDDGRVRHIPDASTKRIGLHSLAHALMIELSLYAGYPIASLRERIYADAEQAGILIYTASSDAAGSLGGLAALSEHSTLARVIAAARERSTWCSSDPVCVESTGSGLHGLNHAACHACLLVPETSCEYGNMLLDRVSVVGGPESRGLGLLSALDFL